MRITVPALALALVACSGGSDVTGPDKPGQLPNKPPADTIPTPHDSVKTPHDTVIAPRTTGLVAMLSDGVVGDVGRLGQVKVTRTVNAKVLTTVAWSFQSRGQAGLPPDTSQNGSSGLDTIPNGDFTGDTLHA